MKSQLWYLLWYGIKDRCLNPKNPKFADYGGRGIKVYEPWIDDLVGFIKYIHNTLGPRPEGMTLDRQNNNGHYEPGNLRWATRSQQSYNRRDRPNATGEKYIHVRPGGKYVVTLRKAGGKKVFTLTHSRLDVVVAARDAAIKRLASELE